MAFDADTKSPIPVEELPLEGRIAEDNFELLSSGVTPALCLPLQLIPTITAGKNKTASKIAELIFKYLYFFLT